VPWIIPSRALARVGITLEQLRQALYARHVWAQRLTGGRWQDIPWHQWRNPVMKPLEALDREVRIDRESLLDTFAGTAAVSSAKTGGRKPSGKTQDRAVTAALDRLIAENRVSFSHGGQVAVARLIRRLPEFADYSVDRITELIRPTYNEIKKKRVAKRQ
jgi:hypothetical protein